MKFLRAAMTLSATSAAALSMIVAMDPASASVTLNVSSHSVVYGGSSGITASLTSTSPSASHSLYVSPQYLNGTLDGTNVQLFAYCVDILQAVGTGSFNVVSLFDYLGGNTTKYNEIASVIAAAGAPGNADSDAEAQAAIWEILFEKQSYDLGHGTFTLSSIHNDSDLVSDTNALMTEAVSDAGKTGTDLNLFVAENSDKQDMLFWTQNGSVPEPASWAMMLLGFGAIGFAMRRKPAVNSSLAQA